MPSPRPSPTGRGRQNRITQFLSPTGRRSKNRSEQFPSSTGRGRQNRIAQFLSPTGRRSKNRSEQFPSPAGRERWSENDVAVCTADTQQRISDLFTTMSCAGRWQVMKTPEAYISKRPGLNHAVNAPAARKTTGKLFGVSRRTVCMPGKDTELKAFQIALLVPGQRPHNGFNRVSFQVFCNFSRIG